jgi:hypothetical protein
VIKERFLDVFRVTYWGQHLRNVWLDELPQLLNLVKGELRIVGVRPSATLFKRVHPEQRKERHRYKPGCIPPYVASADAEGGRVHQIGADLSCRKKKTPDFDRYQVFHHGGFQYSHQKNPQ